MSASLPNLPQGAAMTPLCGPIGAEIHNLDLNRPQPASVINTLHALLLEHRILLFRNQNLSKEEQIAFSGQFGVLEKFPPHRLIDPSAPEIYPVSNDRDHGYVDIGHYWHSDGSFRPKPTVFSFFYMVEAAQSGGETSFTSLTDAYDALDPDVQEEINDLWTIHGNGAMHHLVRTHPETDRKGLYINFGMMTGLFRPNADIVGVTPTRNKELWALLKTVFEREGAAYRHSWQDGDLIISDNRAAAHKASPAGPGTTRLLRRTTTHGTLRV